MISGKRFFTVAVRQMRSAAEAPSAPDETGPVVEGSRKQARPHPLLRVEAELRGEVAKGFERLRVTCWHTRNYRVDAAGRFIARH